MIHFVDTETSGLTDEDEVLSVAIATWDDGKVDVRYVKHFFCQGVISPEAQKVNGYDVETWWKKHDAEHRYAKHAHEITAALEGATVWGGSNPDFDRRMLRGMFRSVRVPWPRIGHRVCDTGSLALPLQVCGAIQSTGLTSLMAYFGLGEQKHSALEDVHATIAVFERLVELYSSAILGDGAGVAA